MKFVAMQPWAEVFHCPGDSQALALCGAVTALDVSQEAAGVADGAVVAISILLGQNCTQGRTTGIGVQEKFLREVGLHQAGERHQGLLEVQEGCLMLRTPKVNDGRIAFLFPGQGIQRSCHVGKLGDVIGCPVQNCLAAASNLRG